MKRFKNYRFRWFICGLVFGFLASVIYLLIEGPPILLFHYDFFEIIGYPGIKLGTWFYFHVYDQGYFAAEVVGCVINGLVYGLLFWMLGALIKQFRKP